MGVSPDELHRLRRGQRLGAAFLLIAVVVGALLATGVLGGGDPARNASVVDGVRGVRETSALLRGVPQDGIRLGRADAPAVVVEFADLKCSACRGFALDDQEQVVRDLVRTGKASLELRLIGLDGFRPDNLTGRTAAYALAAQDRMWPLVELAYWNQGDERERWITDASLGRLAAASPELRGVTVSTRETAESRRLSAEADRLRAALGVDRTPTFYVRPRDETAPSAHERVDVGPFGDRAKAIAKAVRAVTARD
ncbi:thioredoxin domain-containing protein [Patulibacter sp. SYSU D01012]|uniref:thioredoxin domain-containing protein n=1 Tax=Patulibacter sp. SYSU D01012 TaxID=2817381 RepID=UPI001B311B49